MASFVCHGCGILLDLWCKFTGFSSSKAGGEAICSVINPIVFNPINRRLS